MRSFTVTLDESQLENIKTYEGIKRVIAEDLAKQIVGLLVVNIEIRMEPKS